MTETPIKPTQSPKSSPSSPKAKPKLQWVEKIHDVSGESFSSIGFNLRSMVLLSTLVLLLSGSLWIWNQATQGQSEALTEETPEPEPEIARPLTEIVDLTGDVLLSGESQTWLPLRFSDEPAIGDRMQTSPDAALSLRFYGQHLLRMDQNTEIKLLSMEQTADGADRVVLFHRSGRIWQRLLGTPEQTVYELTTPLGNLQLAGSAAFVSEFNDEQTALTIYAVVNGLTVEREGQAVALNQGEQLLLTAEGMGEPSQIALTTLQQTWWESQRSKEVGLGLPLGRLADITPPQVSLFSPEGGSTVSVSDVRVEGETESDVRLLINGQAVPLTQGGQFSQVVSLSEGANAIRLEATDSYGNANQLEISVRREVASSEPDTTTATAPETEQDPVSLRASAVGANTIQASWQTTLAAGDFQQWQLLYAQRSVPTYPNVENAEWHQSVAIEASQQTLELPEAGSWQLRLCAWDGSRCLAYSDVVAVTVQGADQPSNGGSTVGESVALTNLVLDPRASDRLAVSWDLASGQTAEQFGLAWSQETEKPSYCAPDSSSFTDTVSATGQTLTKLAAGTWYVSVVALPESGSPDCSKALTESTKVGE